MIRLIECITNGTKVDINRTGTELSFVPGVLHGHKVKPQKCALNRCLSYYVEPLLYLAPFCKWDVDITLDGLTNAPGSSEPSCDTLKEAWLPTLTRFLGDDSKPPMITIERRGYLPEGGGRVHLKVPIVRRHLTPINVQDVAKIRRIRGHAHGAKVSSTMLNRMMSSAKDMLTGYLKDVYFSTDYRQGVTGGK